MKKILFIVVAVILQGCFYSGMDDDYGYIEPSLKVYVETFISEAQERGIAVDPYYLKLNYSPLEGAAGRTYYTHKQILIDTNTVYWKYDHYRESLVLHELAHLYLGRDHDDTNYGKYCKSIMSSVDNPVYNSSNLNERREYYLDELFNPSTPRPYWAKD